MRLHFITTYNHNSHHFHHPAVKNVIIMVLLDAWEQYIAGVTKTENCVISSFVKSEVL